MKSIATLTVNPSLDKSTHCSGLVPEQKMRCEEPQYDAGGGGINVSKAISRLGTESTAIFTSGGAIGKMLEDLLDNEPQIETKTIKTQNWTRENFIAFDDQSKSQYRFGFSGNPLSADEQEEIKQLVKGITSDFLVISGSLNEDLPVDFYKQLIASKKGHTKIILDTSGEALQQTLEAGVYLVKPNIGELAKLIGKERLEKSEVEQAARQLIGKGSAEIVVVSLGAEGAMLVTATTTEFVTAPQVEKKSTVGAGDSMVGGMVWALSQNKGLREVVQWGVACGSAATMNEGTQLFKAEDAQKLFQSISENAAQ